MSVSDDSLYCACLDGRKQVALELANQNNVNYVDPCRGDTPLHQACERGWLDVVELLIEMFGCDPTVKTKSVMKVYCIVPVIIMVVLIILLSYSLKSMIVILLW